MTPTCAALLGGTSIAHLASVLPDGSPHAVPLWVDTRGDKIVFLTDPPICAATRGWRCRWRTTRSARIVRGRVVTWLEGDAAWERMRLFCRCKFVRG